MTPITQSNTNGQYYLVDASLADFISMLLCNNSQRTDGVFYPMKKKIQYGVKMYLKIFLSIFFILRFIYFMLW